MKIKILHIITSLGSGGAERVLFNLATKSNSEIFEHIVVSIQDQGVYGEELVKLGVKVYTLKVSKFKPWLLLRIFSILKHESPNIIQSWLYHADFLTILIYAFGYRNIIWNIRNNTLKWSMSSKLTIIIRRLCAFFSFVPKRIICCANSAKSEHIKIGYRSEKFLVIGNGYDFTKYRSNTSDRDLLRKELGISEFDFVIGNIGRDDPVKGRDILIKSIALAKENGLIAKLMIIGKGINTSNLFLMELINQNNLAHDVILLEQQFDIQRYYNVMDLFILSSSAEAFPNVLSEAMATEVPCVTTDVGDAKEILGLEELVIDIGDFDGLSKKIISVFNMSLSQRNILGASLRRGIKTNYSMSAMIKSYEKCYRNIKEQNENY